MDGAPQARGLFRMLCVSKIIFSILAPQRGRHCTVLGAAAALLPTTIAIVFLVSLFRFPFSVPFFVPPPAPSPPLCASAFLFDISPQLVLGNSSNRYTNCRLLSNYVSQWDRVNPSIPASCSDAIPENITVGVTVDPLGVLFPEIPFTPMCY